MAELLYGFHQLKDILGERLTEQNFPVVRDAINQANEEYNRQLNTLSGLLVTRTTDYKVRYKQVGQTRNQPLDQNGRSRPVKSAGHYDIALPLQGSGNAWGTNWITSLFMTVQDANDATSLLFDGDTRWMTDHILSALFQNVDWTFEDDEYGALTVKPLANGDATTYAVFTGASSAATDNHFLAQAADIADGANPFPTIWRELTEHPENGGTRVPVVALVASDLKADIENLGTFHETVDVNVRPGANSDELVGSLDVATPGTLIGYDSQVWIVEWPSLPSGMIIATTTNEQKPLAQREYALPELQGFRQVGERADWPYLETQYARFAGFGAWNRVGAVVYQVGAASYSIPSGFAAPMP